MAPHVKGGWGLSSRLGFASFAAPEDVPLARRAVSSHLHYGCVRSKGSF